MLGRAFGAVYTAAVAASAIAYAAAGPLVALAGPQVVFLIAGAGMLAGLAVLAPALGSGQRASSRPRPPAGV
jgi:hypothetical protein